MVGITGLLKIELPSGDVLLNDGGVTVFNSETYRATDSLLGSIAAIEAMSEGAGDTIPALGITFAPPATTAITALSNGAIQKSRVRLWIAEYDTDTGAVVGTPELRFLGFVDQPRVGARFRQFSISIACVPDLEALFFADRGNGLSPTFHKSVYPGELGHDNATGLSIPIAWGVRGAPRGGFGGSGGGGGNGNGGPFNRDVVEQ